MKVFLAVTAVLFGLITIVHVWRAMVEPSVRAPWFIAITIVAALLCIWSIRLLMMMRSGAKQRTE